MKNNYVDKELDTETINIIRGEIFEAKEKNKINLYRTIINRIHEKKEIFQQSNVDGICLLGHSQIDFWQVDFLKKLKVRNCGILGITAEEYYQNVLCTMNFDCSENIYIIMFGTNDLVYEIDYQKIFMYIRLIISYIKNFNKKAEIYFIECISINGRFDRSNQDIAKFNHEIRNRLDSVVIIPTDKMNNERGFLKEEYTTDGLHLSELGYKILKQIIEETIK